LGLGAGWLLPLGVTKKGGLVVNLVGLVVEMAFLYLDKKPYEPFSLLFVVDSGLIKL